MAKILVARGSAFVPEYETATQGIRESLKTSQPVVGHHQSERITITYPGHEDVVVVQNPDGTFNTWYEGY